MQSLTVPAPVCGASREVDLLLSCVRVVLGTANTEDSSRRIPPDLDWPRLVRAALEHGVMPHLYLTAKRIGAALIPPAVLEELRGRFEANAHLNLYRAGELLRLLTLFETHDLPVIPLKGPVLAMSLHGNLAMRQFTDLDLLVPSGQVTRAGDLLETVGYRVHEAGETSVTAERTGREGRVVVDLHWALADHRYSFPLTQDEVRRRMQRVPFMHMMVWQPAADDQFLLLCSHPAKHCWSRLAWVGDIAAFVRAHGTRLNWEQSLQRANALRGRRLFLLGLHLSAELLWSPVPRDVWARCTSDTVVTRLVPELCARMLVMPGDTHRHTGSYGLVDAGLLYVRSREHIADKLPYARYLLRLCRQWWSVRPNERDRAVIALPQTLAVLYVVIRQFRLLRTYGPRLMRYALRAAASLR